MFATEDEIGAAPAGPRLAHASLCADGWETRYARAGAGSPLLVLEGPGSAAGPVLLATLAERFRVFAPDLAVSAAGARSDVGDRPDFLRWLGDFMDGVGIESAPLLVAEPALAERALAFALSEPCRVPSVTLLFDVAGAALEVASLPGRLAAAGLLLRVRPLDLRGGDGSGHEALRALAHELSEGPKGRPHR